MAAKKGTPAATSSSKPTETGSEDAEKKPPQPPQPDQRRDGIWLEVAEVRWEGGTTKACSVLLRADREQPKPIWWPVDDDAVRDGAFETYKAILNEIDKKRMVLARLACSVKPIEGGKLDTWLRCDSFRFQSPELGSR
jgi:hypothetical protein